MKILFVHNALRSFVRVDRDLLASEYSIQELNVRNISDLRALPAAVANCDVLYAWFASLHSLLPVLSFAACKKPSIIVVGGYDTARRPDIGYGSMGHPIKAKVVRLICANATALLVNSYAAQQEVATNIGGTTPIHVVYHGFPTQPRAFDEAREPIVISVGNVSRESLKRKGHEIFVRTARLVPHAQFVLAGQCTDDAADYLRSLAGPNVTITGYLMDHQLQDLFESASVYVQPSEHEGFGCSVAEAMGAGCIPVVSSAGALPEVVGNTGLIVPDLNERAFAAAVSQALTFSMQARQQAARRIHDCFSLDSRKSSLVNLIEQVIRETGPRHETAEQGAPQATAHEEDS